MMRAFTALPSLLWLASMLTLLGMLAGCGKPAPKGPFIVLNPPAQEVAAPRSSRLAETGPRWMFPELHPELGQTWRFPELREGLVTITPELPSFIPVPDPATVR